MNPCVSGVLYLACAGTAAGACFLLSGVSSVLVIDRDEDCLKKSDIFRFDIFSGAEGDNRFTRSYLGTFVQTKHLI